MWHHKIVGTADAALNVTVQPGLPPVLNLSGLVMHSSCTVRSYSIEKHGSTLRVMILIGVVRPGESGTFDINVALDEQTHCVYLGNDETPVWQRRHAAF